MLTDYNSYSQWLPGVTHSRILATEGDIVVAQFNWPVYTKERIVLEFIQTPPDCIVYREAGQFGHRGLSGRWTINSVGASGTELTGEMRLKTQWHRIFANRGKLRAMLNGSLVAIERRVALAAEGKYPAPAGKAKILEVVRRADALEIWLFGEVYELKKVAKDKHS